MKKLLTATLIALLVTCGTATADKGDFGNGENVDPDITSGLAAMQLKEARAKWLDASVRSYSFTSHRGCFCAAPFKSRITVRNGKVIKVSKRPWYGARTVPAMFRIVGQAIKREVAVLDVRYDPQLGFPKRASIDYIAMAADDEMYYRITKFKRLGS